MIISSQPINYPLNPECGLGQPIISPAKLNLYLKVLGRRPDGYHELESLMVKISLADILTFKADSGPKSRLNKLTSNTGQDLPPDFQGPDNLIIKAIAKFQAKTGLKNNYAVDLVKNIPLGAGLGGGSSNGAIALKFLNELNKRPLSDQELIDLAATIGADVPFFLWPFPAAVVRGVGEQLSAAPTLSGQKFVLVNPGIHLNTGEVFKNLGLTISSNSITLPFLVGQTIEQPQMVEKALKYQDCAAFGQNDLLKAALRLAPELNAVVSYLAGLKSLNWSLSGSGSTFWLQCEEGAEEKLAQKIEKEKPGWFIYLTQALSIK